MEIRQKRKNLKKEKKEADRLKKLLFETLGLLTGVYVKKFLHYQVKSYETLVKSIHKRKLENLGLSPIQSSAQLYVVRNLSSRSLTEIEYKCLNYGLKFGVFPSFFNHIKVQTEFEDLYQQVRPHLDNNERIEFKSRLINLYSKYKSSFFYKRSHQDLGLSHEERVVLENLSKDKTIIICKPDKGNGVVVMNRDDYVRKMNKILQDST